MRVHEIGHCARQRRLFQGMTNAPQKEIMENYPNKRPKEARKRAESRYRKPPGETTIALGCWHQHAKRVSHQKQNHDCQNESDHEQWHQCRRTDHAEARRHTRRRIPPHSHGHGVSGHLGIGKGDHSHEKSHADQQQRTDNRKNDGNQNQPKAGVHLAPGSAVASRRAAFLTRSHVLFWRLFFTLGSTGCSFFQGVLNRRGFGPARRWRRNG